MPNINLLCYVTTKSADFGKISYLLNLFQTNIARSKKSGKAPRKAPAKKAPAKVPKKTPPKALKKHKFKRGTVALREIRKYQKCMSLFCLLIHYSNGYVDQQETISTACP